MACFFASEKTPKSQEIDEELAREKKRLRKVNEVKLLLLGPGESGKSTVFKQLKIIQTVGDKGFSDQERMAYKHVVHSNCIEQMRLLTQFALRNQLAFASEDNKNHAKVICSLPQGLNNVCTPAIGAAIKALWADPNVVQIHAKANEYQLQPNDTAVYFFANIDRFVQTDYVPSEADVLRTRVRSSGIEEATFTFDKMIFRVVDVGGQRSERRKWIHCFDCVKAVLFCVALSDFDLNLRELRTVNRMHEALDLFEDVNSSTFFGEASIILFLNKTDLFKEKIERGVDLRKCFKNYQGGANYDSACQFIKARFLERVANAKPIYHHFTCAIDTQNIEHVINDVRKTVLQEFLEEINPI